MARHIPEAAIKAMLAREETLFTQRNPISKRLSDEAARNWLNGVPMHWMVDWGTPFPLFVAKAQGVDVTDADGNAYADFCLGDTGAMFGHSPPPVVEALTREGANGFTTMMPSPDAAIVGRLLEDRFGLPCWQVTATASDANRAVIKWCRAISGRKKILVFNHCYHGAVDETHVTNDGGEPHADPALIGEVRDLTQFAKVIEFNDIPALERALEERDVACVLAEPIMTNVGMVMPDEGYHAALREVTRRTGTLLVIDETHCISSGPGGYTREYGLEPDAIVLGKPIAGGIPAAVYGFSAEVRERIRSIPREAHARPFRNRHHAFGLQDPARTDARGAGELFHHGGFRPPSGAGEAAGEGDCRRHHQIWGAVARRPCRGPGGVHVHSPAAPQRRRGCSGDPPARSTLPCITIFSIAG